MSNPELSDYDAIAGAVQHYIDGAKSGKGNVMKLAFHESATIFGHYRGDLMAGPIKLLLDHVDESGPVPELQAKIASIDIVDTVATVRLELDKWAGDRFTDFFTVLKSDGEWKITNKIFHLHP